MTCNVGTTDRLLRAIVGSAIIALGIYFQSWWGLIGVIPLLTALSAVCPSYMPFKISTAKEPATAPEVQETKQD